jgi:hypothetical protein
MKREQVVLAAALLGAIAMLSISGWLLYTGKLVAHGRRMTLGTAPVPLIHH